MQPKYRRMRISESAPPGNSLTANHTLEEQIEKLAGGGSHESKDEDEIRMKS